MNASPTSRTGLPRRVATYALSSLLAAGIAGSVLLSFTWESDLRAAVAHERAAAVKVEKKVATVDDTADWTAIRIQEKKAVLAELEAQLDSTNGFIQ